MRGRWLVIAVAGLLAGCSAPPEPDAQAPLAPLATKAPLALARPLATPTTLLPVSISLSQTWLRPFGAFDATLDAPADARVAWFVEHEEVDPRATIVGGEIYVLKSTTPDDRGTPGPRSRAEVAGLAPDGRVRSLRFDAPGRYLLEAGSARMAISVFPGAPADAPAQTFLVEEGALVFEPDHLEIAPGARVLFWSDAPAEHDVREAAFAAYVPTDARGTRITPIDEGLYRLVAVASGPRGAIGVARVPFLVDFERPSALLTIGPATGRFLAPEADAQEDARVPFTAALPLRTLSLRVNVSSPAPLPASVELTLEHEGDLVARVSSLTAPGLDLTDLPAGKYVATLRGEHGAYVGFELTGNGSYRLPTPERLRLVQSE